MGSCPEIVKVILLKVYQRIVNDKEEWKRGEIRRVSTIQDKGVCER